MLVKPPTVLQPIDNVEKPQVISNNSLQTKQNIINNDPTGLENRNIELSNKSEGKDIIIRNKKAYKRFIRLIKTGKFTTAMLTAKIIGVERNTVMTWLRTKAVIDCMNEEVNNYISKIQSSKDWKAQAYLLDRTLDDKDKITSESNDIRQMIVINT